MAKKLVTLEKNFDNAVETAATTLLSGGILVFPTETVYGIGVAANNQAALEKLRQLKQRGKEKPFQLLTADITAAKKIGALFSTRCLRLADAFWPGPLTMVVPDASGSGTLGIRVPDSQFVLALCRKLEIPIISSSANRAGKAPALSAAEADVFGNEVDLLVDGGAIAIGTPSTVVRCAEEKFEILRAGGIDAETIASAWNGDGQS